MDSPLSTKFLAGSYLVTVISLILGGSISLSLFFGLKESQHYLQRMLIIFMSFVPTMIILSISYEVFFFFFLSLTLLLWVLLERKIYIHEEMGDLDAENEFLVNSTMITHRGLLLRDSRKAVFFLFFINISFLGTGNVASLGSFSLESVYRLTTVFNPFLMGALLILKILVPFFVLSAAFGILGLAIQLPSFSLFLLALCVNDIGTLNFFFLVQDEGSWLDIGTSISHFCISSLFVVFAILLFVISHGLIRGVLVPSLKHSKKQT